MKQYSPLRYHRPARYWPVMLTMLIMALCLSQKFTIMSLVGSGFAAHHHTDTKTERAQEGIQKTKVGMCKFAKQLLSVELTDIPLLSFTDNLPYLHSLIRIAGTESTAPPGSGQFASLRRHLINCVFHE